MGKLGNISGNEAVKAFEKAGGEKIGQVGSHLVMIKRDAYQSLYSNAQGIIRWHPARVDPEFRDDRG